MGELMAGRPTKYTPELLEKAAYYVDNFLEFQDPVPSHESLAMEIGISRSTLYEWGSDPEKQEFSDILERCNLSQTRNLFRGALTGDMNANITKLMLGKQGYSEKNQTELTGADGKDLMPVSIKVVYE